MADARSYQRIVLFHNDNVEPEKTLNARVDREVAVSLISKELVTALGCPLQKCAPVRVRDSRGETYASSKYVELGWHKVGFASKEYLTTTRFYVHDSLVPHLMISSKERSETTKTGVAPVGIKGTTSGKNKLEDAKDKKDPAQSLGHTKHQGLKDAQVYVVAKEGVQASQSHKGDGEGSNTGQGDFTLDKKLESKSKTISSGDTRNQSLHSGSYRRVGTREEAQSVLQLFSQGSKKGGDDQAFPQLENLHLQKGEVGITSKTVQDGQLDSSEEHLIEGFRSDHSGTGTSSSENSGSYCLLPASEVLHRGNRESIHRLTVTLMARIYAIVDICWHQRVRHHGSSEGAQGHNYKQESVSTSGNANSRSDTGRKRGKIGASPTEWDDQKSDSDGGEGGIRSPAEMKGKKKRAMLACPFNKFDPHTYRSNEASGFRYVTCEKPQSHIK